MLFVSPTSVEATESDTGDIQTEVEIDEYRQITFEIVTEDGKNHGRFIGPIKTIILDSYEETNLPNNTVNVPTGKSMNQAGVEIPAYEIDQAERWKLKEICDTEGNPISESALLNTIVTENQTYKIVVCQDLNIIEADDIDDSEDNSFPDFSSEESEITDNKILTLDLDQEKVTENKINNEELDKKLVKVPAIWRPVDSAGELVPGLSFLYTDPDMDIDPNVSEVARPNKEGVYEIHLMGLLDPATTDNKWTSNNFNYTQRLWFSDKFHRVVARGFGRRNPEDQDAMQGYESAVLRVEYADRVWEKLKGIDGTTSTPYQEGNTMTLDVMTTEYNLSTADYMVKDDYYKLYRATNVLPLGEALLENVIDVRALSNDAELISLDLTKLDKLFIADLDGNFVMDGAEYKNFINDTLDDLPTGQYRAVFPIYWNEPAARWMGFPDQFSRYRFTFNDTFHFPFTVVDPVEVEVKGFKGLSGDGKTSADISEGLFSFKVTADPTNPDGVIGVPTENVNVLAGGDIDFGTWSFSKEGTYKFTVAENTPPENYTGDADVTVTVEVTYDTTENILKTYISYSSGRYLQFENVYTKPAEEPTETTGNDPTEKPTEPSETDPTDKPTETTKEPTKPTEKISITTTTKPSETPKTGELGQQGVIMLVLLLATGVTLIVLRKKLKA